MVERSVERCQSLVDLSCARFETREMCDMGDGVKRVLTLLSDEVNQGDESDIRRRGHGMAQQDSAEPDAALVTKDDGASCTQTHPVDRSQF